MTPHPVQARGSYASLFGGGALADIGAKQAGYTPTWSIEVDERIAEVARHNLKHEVHVMDILDADPYRFERPTWLHSSPPCQNHSAAKTNGKETALDIALAEKTAEFIRVLAPEKVTIENVMAYRHSKSWAIIAHTLSECGYFFNARVWNAADVGVPQTRKRMIVRAVKGGMVPEMPPAQPWCGWYGAIEDLIPGLPESEFAPWQLERLPADIRTLLLAQGAYDGEIVTANSNQGGVRAFIVHGTSTLDTRRADQPSAAVVAKAAMPKAWLVGDQRRQLRKDSEPAVTVRAGETGGAEPRAWLSQGSVVRLTPRCLARFQSLDDAYELPEQNGLACRIIGNGIPPRLMQAVGRSLT